MVRVSTGGPASLSGLTSPFARVAWEGAEECCGSLPASSSAALLGAPEVLRLRLSSGMTESSPVHRSPTVRRPASVRTGSRHGYQLLPHPSRLRAVLSGTQTGMGRVAPGQDTRLLETPGGSVAEASGLISARVVISGS